MNGDGGALQKSHVGESLGWNGPAGKAMLDLPRPAPPPPRGPRVSVPDRTDWLQAWRVFRKHWRLSAVFSLSVMVAVLAVTLCTRPVYAPVARLEIDPPGAELFSMEGRGGSESGADYLETQARNLQSEQLLISVMQQLHLEQVPEFAKPGFASRMISAVSTTIDRLLSWFWVKKNSDLLAPNLSGLPVLSTREASVLRTMQNQLSVKRDTASRLVSVSFSSHDPVLSATVTNALVRSFIDRTYQARHAAIMEATEWLGRQLDDIRAKMEAANRSLADFQQRSGIADIDQNRSTFTEQIAELSRQKTQSQAERIQIESYLRQARDGNVQTLPQIQGNQVVQLLTQRLGEKRAELAQTLAVYGKNHPNARKLQNEIGELESQIELQQKTIVGQMETTYTAALSRERMIDAQLQGTTRELDQMARYAALRHEAQANSDLYNALYARVKEAGITAASKSLNVRVVDPARVLDSPTRPKPLMNLGIGFLVALVGGLLVGFIRETLDTKVSTLEDVRQSFGIASIAIVPKAEVNGHSSALGALTSMISRAPKGLGADVPAKFLLETPNSEQSEAFRSIRTSVMLSRSDHPPHVLLVTSSLPGEGKTTVAINLAMALAQQGQTCIVDADLRRSSVARTFRVTQETGLADFLAGLARLDSIVTPAPSLKELTILPAGKTLSDPGRFINSETMRLLVHSLRDLYDFVVIDSPPVLPYADGRALAPLVDGVVFVARAGAITRDAMARSMELLQEVHSAPILEVVLNGASADSQWYGYPYKYNHPANS